MQNPERIIGNPTVPSGRSAPVLDADTAQALKEIRERCDLPALAVAVSKGGEVCDRAAVGVRKAGNATPVAIDDQFHIGSCTKSMTATLVAMLVEEGRLRWDTTISDVFREWEGKIDRQCEAVTVAHLLTHRGGVANNPSKTAWSRAWEENGTPMQQRQEFAQAVLACPPVAAPGTKMVYSNSGYAVISAMIEKIIDQPWELLTTEKLFRPLHMDSAGFGPPGTKDQLDQPWGPYKDEVPEDT